MNWKKASLFQGYLYILEWCGEEYRFFTWGDQDVMELQRNMKYYNLLKLMPGPVHYYDVQKLFSIKFEDGISRRSLEYATDYLQLPKNRDFHRALADASYTARILLEIDEACMIRHPSLDVYQNPKSRDSEIYISYTDHDKFVSREFVSKERLMKDRTMVSTMCPICRCPAKRKIRSFSTNISRYITALPFAMSMDLLPERSGFEKPMRKIFRGEDPESRRYRSGG